MGESKKEKFEYYRRLSGVIVRVRNGVTLEYLSREFEWIPNQEWFLSMFVDGNDSWVRISEDEVNAYLEENLNSKKITR